jgi:hypothetical protein
MANYKYDLEERLIQFAVDVILVCGKKGANLIKNIERLELLLMENNELIAIFVSSIRTSQNNNKI